MARKKHAKKPTKGPNTITTEGITTDTTMPTIPCKSPFNSPSPSPSPSTHPCPITDSRTPSNVAKNMSILDLDHEHVRIICEYKIEAACQAIADDPKRTSHEKKVGELARDSLMRALRRDYIGRFMEERVEDEIIGF